MFPCISECALLGRKAALRIWSRCFSSVTHLFSLSFWDQLCVSQCLVSCSVPLALSNWISGKCFKSWLSNSSSAPAKWCFFNGLSQWPIKPFLLHGKNRCSYVAGNWSANQVMTVFTWNVVAQLIPILPCLICQRMLPFSQFQLRCVYIWEA